MRSPSAFDLRDRSACSSRRPRVWAAALALAAGLSIRPGAARADDKQACSAAYTETQTLRLARKLSAARQQAVTCTRDVCPEFIRTDCVKWLDEIASSQPTVVFEVSDVKGKDTTAVRVALDGKPWLAKLELTAVAIDPGDHMVRYEIDGASPHEESVRIREGEKNRKLTFSFPLESKPSVAPWVVGGAGVAGLIVGGVFGGLTLAAKSTVNGGCNDTMMTCTMTAHSAAENGKTFGPVSTVGWIVGGLGIGTSVVLFATRKSPSSAATVGMGPVVTPSSAWWRVEGSF